MINPNDPAYPCTIPVMETNKENGLLYKIGEKPREGLTKREYFAAMAMQGILTNAFTSNLFKEGEEGYMQGFNEVVASDSLKLADALIAELSKEPPQ